MKSIARENGGGVGKSCLDLARTVTHFETHYKFFLKLCLVTNEKKNVVPTNVGLMHHKKGSFHQIKTSTKPFFKNVMVQYFQIQKYSHLFTSFQCHSNQFVAHFFVRVFHKVLPQNGQCEKTKNLRWLKRKFVNSLHSVILH